MVYTAAVAIHGSTRGAEPADHAANGSATIHVHDSAANPRRSSRAVLGMREADGTLSRDVSRSACSFAARRRVASPSRWSGARLRDAADDRARADADLLGRH